MKQKISFFFLEYLKLFAQIQLAKVKLIQKLKHQTLTIVGITGSAGKSSTLLICESALKPNFKVKTNNGYNSESGIPLSLLGLKISNYHFLSWLKIAILAPLSLLFNWKTYQILLLEMGIDSPTYPKNMDFLLSIAKPDIAIFLNVTSVHMLNFNNLNQIAQEKAKLINQSQLAIINASDPLVEKYTTNQNVICLIPTSISIPKTFVPKIYHIGFGAALSLGTALGLNHQTIIKNIQNHFFLPPSRASILEGIGHSTLIDSSYNSSPLACLEMLNFLNTFKSPKIAILGDMRELGKNSKIEHQKIYQKAISVADQIISVGPETKKYFGPKAQKFTYWWQAAEFIKNNLPKKSTILIKGSQNTIYLEELVKSILKNPSDSNKLCRQTTYWLKIKSQFQQKNQV